MVKQDVSLSPARIAHIDYVPPEYTFASFWIKNGSTATALFSITAPVGTVVDVDFEWMLNVRASGDTVTTNSGMTAGVVYYLALTSATNSSQLQPFSLNALG
jgi:hypothetical protein